MKKRNRGRFEGVDHFAELGGADMNMIEALLNFRNRQVPGENRPEFRDPISQMLLMMG